jgi:hypothetical protein
VALGPDSWRTGLPIPLDDLGGIHGNQPLHAKSHTNISQRRVTFDAKRHTIHFMGPNIGKEQSEIKIEEIEGSCKMRFVDNLERALDPQDIVDISLTDLLQLN